MVAGMLTINGIQRTLRHRELRAVEEAETARLNAARQ